MKALRKKLNGKRKIWAKLKKKKKNRLTVIEAQLSGFNEVIYAREQDYFKNYQIKLLKTILFPFCAAQQERKVC